MCWLHRVDCMYKAKQICSIAKSCLCLLCAGFVSRLLNRLSGLWIIAISLIPRQILGHVLKLGSGSLLPDIFQIIVTYHPINRNCVVLDTKSVV